MAYRADIEIAVKGAQELKRLQDRIRNVSTTVDNFNSKIEEIGGGYIVRNINNLTSLLGQAAAEFNKVALGTADATAAARTYIAANDQLNAGLAERVALLKSVNEQARLAKLAEGSRLFGGPRIVETRGTVELGPGPASPVGALVGQKSPVEERIKRTITARKEEAALQEALLKLEIRSAATANERLQLERQLALVTAQNVRAKKVELAGPQFPMAGPMGLGVYGQGRKAAAGGVRAGGFGKAAGGAISNAAIGGAFPLLFGQSGAAAAGGALGGIAGSLLGPSGGFAGSLVGTILGEKLGQGNQIKQLGEDIGFSAEQTKILGIAFQQAGRDFDKFQQSVSTIQGLSLSIEDQAKAIQLASTLTENYGGKIDKVTNAFANALSTGKVTQGTLNQLTGQAIPIQQALADKYNVSRSAILQMAKDGKISVQDLIDTLVKVGNEGTKSATSQQKAFNDAYTSIEEAGNRLATTISNVLGTTADDINNKLNKVLLDTLNYISDLIDGFNEVAKVVGPVVKFIVDGYIAINTAIWNAINSVPGLTQGILQFAATVLGPLGQVAYLINSIRGVGAAAKGKLPQSAKPKPRPPLESFAAPAQFVPDSKNTAADKAAKAAEREAARVANIVRDRAAATEQLRLQMQYSHGIFVAETAKDPFLKMELELQQKIGEISLDYSKQINDEKAKGNSAAVKEAITQHALAKTEAERLKYAMDVKKLELERKENYDNVLMDLDQELQLRSATTEEARNQLRIEYEMAKLKQTGMYNSDQLTAIQNRKQQLAAPKTPYETINLARGAAFDELTKLLDVGNQIVTIGDAIGTSFGESFKGIISGTMTAQEALASFFQSVADAFLDMAAQIIAKWIQMTILNTILSIFPGGGNLGNNFNGASSSLGAGATGSFNLGPQFSTGNVFGGFLASGGPAMANTPYIVGEKGPELFMPGRSGTVIPNDALGGGTTNVVVNVDASGNSNVQGDQQQAKQLGVAVSAAVQAELVKQQRPGGLLAGTRR